MTAIQTSLQFITRRNDVLLAFFLVAIIFMMVLPMPTWLVDTLIAMNIALSIILLMVGVYVSSPLAFSTFPAMLLLTTLFRLALSITTTRLILLQADAGAIITTFGNFVVGGNIVVGIVVFSIITVVQFIVITKGSERVAEVSARFSLDGMPGKQMSIDGDMRAGVIEAQEARRRRRVLEQESQLYGSMDGAMKFVKGDAIAGIFIILINIIGGISIGTMQQDMSMGEAGHLYTILTVGDGLVAQIPALFIAITAGIIVTRVSGDKKNNLGDDIGKQLFSEPKALLIGAAALFIFAIVPGFPTPIFLTFGIILGSAGLFLTTNNKRIQDMSGAFLKAMREVGKEELPSPDEAPVVAVPLSINMESTLQPNIKHDILNAEFIRIGERVNMELGVPFPGVHIRYREELEERRYNICLNEVPVASGELRMDQIAVFNQSDKLKEMGIVAEETVAFLPEEAAAKWLPADQQVRLQQAAIKFMDAHKLLSYHLSITMDQYAEEFVGLQQTANLIDKLKPSAVDLVKEVQAILPLPVIGVVLKNLVSERVSIRNLRSIFEALLKSGKDEKDPEALTEFARAELSRQISYRYSGEKNVMAAIMLDINVEEMVRKAIKKDQTGSYLSLDPNVGRQFVASVKNALDGIADKTQKPVLLTSVDIRRYVYGLIKPYLAELPVLSYQEIAPEVSLQPIGRINLN